MHKFHLHKGGILFYHDILAQVSLDPKVAFVSRRFPMSLRQAARRGVTTAVHTDVQVLHPAAMQDFLQRMRQLLDGGDQAEAEVLWDSTFEVVHMPPPFNPIKEFGSLPPLRRVPCTREGCQRCAHQLGGYQFPWVGTWARSSVAVRPGTSPEQAWMDYHSWPETIDLLAVERLASGYKLEDFVPRQWDALVAHCSDVPGCATVQDLYEAFRGWQLGHELWRDPHAALPARALAIGNRRHRSQRALAAWMDALLVDTEHFLPAACCKCGGTTRRICAECRVASCWECARAGDEDAVCCEESREAGGTARFDLPAARCGETTGRFLQQPSEHGLEDPEPQMGSQKGWLLWTATGLAMTAHRPVHCGKDEDDYWLPVQESSTASSSSMQGGPARWAATTALETAARERVLGWRLERGLEDDADFAYRWASHEEAIVNAGHAVAHEWLRIRAEQTVALLPALLPAVAQVIDELPKPGPSVAPSIRRELQEKPKAKAIGRKRPGVRLRANPSDAPEAITTRVEALTGVMMRLGALAPSGAMNQALQAEWHQACNRLSQRLVTNAEKSTVLNAISTAEELRQFMRSRDRGCLPEKVDLDAFLHSKTTKAPVRALASLKWLNNNGQLGWSIQDLAPPAGPKGRRARKGQAEAITPPMLALTEETIERMQSAGNEKWTALLGCWLIATGCLRYRHIQRASPKRLSLSTAHCFCWRGKQKSNRTGFHFSVPSEFGSGFQWTKPWLELYKSLGVTQRDRAGLCFDRHGSPWAISEINAVAQEVFSSSMDNVEALTTYSFRRWGPTFGQSLALTPMELNALGDWQAKGETPRDAVMPLHYSSARYAESMKMKHLLMLSSPFICEYEAWEVIPPSVLREAKTQGRQALDRQVHRDIQTVWTQPISPGEALTKFKLSKALMARASQLKEKASKAAEVRAMPATLGDKVLSAFLKNGQTLCGAYQIHRCGRSEDQCDALHKCAVVLRSARVCGGRHAAVDCHDKRSLKVCNDDASKDETKKPQGAKEGRLPQPKKRPQPKSPDHPPPSKRARDDQPGAGNRQEEAKFDRLATAKGKTAQRPTLVLEHSNGGAIWLSGLPTVNTLEAFPAVSLQIVCFSEALERRGGICCPGAQCLVLAPTDKDKRDSQWKEAWPLLRQTYFGGESTLIHCMAGRHRAAGIAVLLRSLLLDCTIEESASAIAAKRDIEFDKLVSTKHVAEWIWWTYRHATVGAPLPQLDGYMATERSQLHLRTIHDAPLCRAPKKQQKGCGLHYDLLPSKRQ